MEDRHSTSHLAPNLQELLRTATFFADLPEAARRLALDQAVVRSHPANQMILLENDWGSSVYFILNGWLKIRTFNADGKEITLNIIGKGEIVGEMSALEQSPRSTDVLSLTPVTIANIPATDFVQLLRSEPLAGIKLAQLMGRRLRQLNRRLRLRESHSTARVADTLLFLVEGQGVDINSDQGAEIPNFPHRELSSMSGLARETVTRVLTKLERDGLIIRSADKMTIPDISALEASIF
jgi:CRP/FNR family transcriptional regulator, cyclic AMP receptor protein